MVHDNVKKTRVEPNNRCDESDSNYIKQNLIKKDRVSVVNNAFADEDEPKSNGYNNNGYIQYNNNNNNDISMERMNTAVPFSEQNNKNINKCNVFAVNNTVLSNTTHSQLQKQPLSIKEHTNDNINSDHLRIRSKNKIKQEKDSNIKPFICSHCGKQFKHKHNLQNHVKVHYETAPKCPECGKQFSRKSNLKQHLLIHSDIKPFKCDYCERAFRQKHVLSSLKDLFIHSILILYHHNSQSTII